jgi:hypothetical protein
MRDGVESCVAHRQKTHLLGGPESRGEKMVQPIGFDCGPALAGLRQQIERRRDSLFDWS